MAKKAKKDTDYGSKKTKCPITRGEFAASSEDMTIKVGNDKATGTAIASPRTFKSGGLGWYAGEKVNLHVNGKIVKCQMTCSIVVIGSKDLDEE